MVFGRNVLLPWAQQILGAELNDLVAYWNVSFIRRVKQEKENFKPKKPVSNYVQHLNLNTQ